MKRLLLITFAIGLFAIGGHAQMTDCPSGKVCLDQSVANKLLDSVNALVEAKTLIQKLMTERGASDAVIASANRVIADYAQLDLINGMMIVKYKSMMELYEKVISMQSAIIDKLTAQLNKPRSGWQKLVNVIEKITYLLAGAAIGRAGIIH